MFKKTTKVVSLIIISTMMILCFTSSGYAQTNDTTSEISVETTVPVAANAAKETVKKNKPFTRYVKVKKARYYTRKNHKYIKKGVYYKGQKLRVINSTKKMYKLSNKCWIRKDKTSKNNPMKKFKNINLLYYKTYNVTKNKLTRSKGVNYYNNHKETWYSQKVLPGGGLKIPGRHIAKDGTIRDGSGYIVISANYLKRGTTILTSLGPAKVYDTGGMTGKWIDIYTNW